MMYEFKYFLTLNIMQIQALRPCIETKIVIVSKNILKGCLLNIFSYGTLRLLKNNNNNWNNKIYFTILIYPFSLKRNASG